MEKKYYVAIFILVLVLVLGVAGIAFWDLYPLNTQTGLGKFQEDFETGIIDAEIWTLTQEGDITTKVTEVSGADSGNGDLYRLKLGMDTIGTSDDTVKFMGIRSVRPVIICDGKDVSFELDWNNQSNGCYLSAAFYLCPTATERNPEEEADWLKFEYIGVPPGYNARALIASKADGRVENLWTDDWPDQKTGRSIGNQHIQIIIEEGRITVLENGNMLYSSKGPVIEFSSAFLYLQMSSHSNYPFREIYFDTISVT